MRKARCALLVAALCVTALASAQTAIFDVPASEAVHAISEFARQAGLQIVAPADELKGITTPAIKGTLDTRDALRRLLVGTGLEIASDDGSIITLRKVSKERIDDSKRPGTAGNAAPESEQLEEIVVTAQKRQESQQTVPISMQVISSLQLTEQNQTSLEGLTQTTPGVFVGDAGKELFIRGIGSIYNPSFDQSVAMFTDDIYHGRSRMSVETFLDLDHIEVLKGPQSTFFGNNAIAGALNIVTKKPGDQFDADGRLLYGSYGRYAAEGAVGGPITDYFGARLAITRNGVAGGWIDNLDIGEHVPRINDEAARLTLDLHPNADFDATMKIEGNRNRTAGTFADEPFQFNDLCLNKAPIPLGFGDLGFCKVALANNVPFGLNQNNISSLAGQYQQLSTFEDVLTLNYHQWGHTFTSVSGFYNYHFNANIAWLPVSYITDQTPESYNQFSQEFRVASPLGGALEYLAGAYFQTDHLAYSQDYDFSFLGDLGNPALDPYLPLNDLTSFSQQERVYSLFGSLTWNAADRLKLSASLRGSEVVKDVVALSRVGAATQVYGGYTPIPAPLETYVANIITAPPGVTPNLNKRNGALMPSARIQYQLKPAAMVYVRYDRGFKAGGYNGYTGFGAPASLVYGPEHVDAYELGLKSTWMDERVLLNVDVFRSDYKDLQVDSSVFVPAANGYTTQVGNAAASRSQGVELEGQWAPTKGLRLRANLTYLDSDYVSYKNGGLTLLQNYCFNGLKAAYAQVPQCLAFPHQGSQDLSGHPTDFAPKWSGSINASYTQRLPGEYKLTGEVTPYFTSWYFSDSGSNADPLVVQSGYMRVDARLALETPDGHWGLDLIGKNLTNRVIITANETAHEIQAKEEPRNVAIQLRYRFR